MFRGRPVGDSRDGKTRWKGPNACAIATAEPLSSMYATMRGWKPLSGFFQGSAVLVCADGEQARVLNRACFGRPFPPPIVQVSPFAESGAPHSLVGSKSTNNECTQLFQLGLEEAFYLSYELKCVDVSRQTPKGITTENPEELWKVMLSSKPQFLQHYKAYSYLRDKRWVVLSGIQYGADFVAYRHHPTLVHSEYAVIVISEEQEKTRVSTWTDIHAMGRLCGSVAKTLLLLHITHNSNLNLAFPRCLENSAVEAVEVERWIPEKHRETASLGEDTVHAQTPLLHGTI